MLKEVVMRLLGIREEQCILDLSEEFLGRRDIMIKSSMINAS